MERDGKKWERNGKEKEWRKKWKRMGRENEMGNGMGNDEEGTGKAKKNSK